MRIIESEKRKLYYFRSKSGKRMTKFSADTVTQGEIDLYEIPDFLIEKEEKKKAETSKRPVWSEDNLP